MIDYWSVNAFMKVGFRAIHNLFKFSADFMRFSLECFIAIDFISEWKF